ncbi:uncharacterized protein LOC128722187 [Anopheles nili]|uniref:uncharacterized protein LOC128722187 n=1 Tax=Anopheles nili TaxID=185578 RepID=UPI00237B2803|nr:uncharacterized protein LOC128722187 [Anopheles nili]
MAPADRTRLRTMEWKRNAMDKLIQEYKKHPVLYDMRHPRYYNKNIRRQALTSLVDEMQDVRPDTTLKDVLRKIQSMRTQFGQEITKARRHLRNGTEYTPTVWWYQGLSFLQHHIKHRTADSSHMATDSDASWKQEIDDNSTYNVSIVRNGGSGSPTDLNSADFEHSNDGTEFETEVHYEINPIDVKNIKSVELKPILPPVNANKRELRSLPERTDRKMARLSQGTLNDRRATSSPLRQDLSVERQDASGTIEVLAATNTSAFVENATLRTFPMGDDRSRSLGDFICAQMCSIKDNYTFYETQMEILNVVNRGILRQLAIDKGCESGTDRDTVRSGIH